MKFRNIVSFLLCVVCASASADIITFNYSSDGAQPWANSSISVDTSLLPADAHPDPDRFSYSTSAAGGFATNPTFGAGDISGSFDDAYILGTNLGIPDGFLFVQDFEGTLQPCCAPAADIFQLTLVLTFLPGVDFAAITADPTTLMLTQTATATIEDRSRSVFYDLTELGVTVEKTVVVPVPVPVPEPSTLGLLALGLIGLGAARRHR